MFSNSRNLQMMKNILGLSLGNSKNLIRFNLLNNRLSVKRFSAHVENSHSNGHATEEGHGHGHGKGDGHNDHHEDHHDDHHGHHDITGEVDLNKVYVPLSADRANFISLTGVPNNQKQIHKIIECQTKARNEITPISIPLITRSRVYFKDLANVSYEDNPYFHPEPYGYLVSDDPFDPNPSIYQTFYLLAIAFFAYMFLSKIFRMNNLGDSKTMSQEIYHAHYTANLIEDEIRKIRKEDYSLRKRYDEIKRERSGEKSE